MLKLITGLGFVVSVFLSVSAFAAPPHHDSRGGHDGSRVRECRQNNRHAHAEVVDLFHRARSHGRISQSEAHRFREMEARLSRHHSALAHDGLTLRECERLGREIARERSEVRRMARSHN